MSRPRPDTVGGSPAPAKTERDPFVVLSIDPGMTCGLALVNLRGDWISTDPAEHILLVASKPYLDVLLGLAEYAEGARAVVVEDTRSQPMHAKRRGGSMGEMIAKARAIGHTDCMTTLLELRCADLGLPCLPTPPPGPKWKTKKELKTRTNYAGQTNQHVRDAIRNAWSLTPAHFEHLLSEATP